MLKSFALVTAALALTAATASAESYDATQPVAASNGYFGAGATIGAARGIKGGMFIDGAKRLGETPLFVRGQMTGGKSGSEGSYTQFRAGIEARGCVAQQFVCAFGGVDAGYQRDHMVERLIFTGENETIDANDLVAVPRAGLEVGRKIRLRSIIEAPLYNRLGAPSEMTTSNDRGAGLMLSLAVAGTF